jgi:hypothetical protein
MDDEDGYGWCEIIYTEALRLHKPSRYKMVNKLKFLALTLKLFVEIQNEHAIIEVKAVNIKFKFRSKSYVFWVFEIPDFKDRKLYLAYMSNHLSKL